MLPTLSQWVPEHPLPHVPCPQAVCCVPSSPVLLQTHIGPCLFLSPAKAGAAQGLASASELPLFCAEELLRVPVSHQPRLLSPCLGMRGARLN